MNRAARGYVARGSQRRNVGDGAVGHIQVTADAGIAGNGQCRADVGGAGRGHCCALNCAARGYVARGSQRRNVGDGAVGHVEIATDAGIAGNSQCRADVGGAGRGHCCSLDRG